MHGRQDELTLLTFDSNTPDMLSTKKKKRKKTENTKILIQA